MKKICTILFAALLAGNMFAATTYLYVGDHGVTDENYATLSADLKAKEYLSTGNIYYDPATKALLMENATLETATIKAVEVTRVVLIGKNYVKAGRDKDGKYINSIEFVASTNPEIVITGPGELHTAAIRSYVYKLIVRNTRVYLDTDERYNQHFYGNGAVLEIENSFVDITLCDYNDETIINPDLKRSCICGFSELILTDAYMKTVCGDDSTYTFDEMEMEFYDGCERLMRYATIIPTAKKDNSEIIFSVAGVNVTVNNYADYRKVLEQTMLNPEQLELSYSAEDANGSLTLSGATIYSGDSIALKTADKLKNLYLDGVNTLNSNILQSINADKLHIAPSPEAKELPAVLNISRAIVANQLSINAINLNIGNDEEEKPYALIATGNNASLLLDAVNLHIHKSKRIVIGGFDKFSLLNDEIETEDVEYSLESKRMETISTHEAYTGELQITSIKTEVILNVNANVNKRLIGGQLIIERAGKTYNVQGAELK